MTMTATWFRPRAAGGTTLILLTMSLGVLVAQIDTSVVNLAVKEIGASLDAGVTALQWVVDAYNLVYASLLLTAGTLADLYGRRRIFALGIALFTLGSLVCGLAPNAAVLVAGRAVAGLGAALEVPRRSRSSPSPIRARSNAPRRWAFGQAATGLLSLSARRSAAYWSSSVGWRSIFLLIIPLCVLALGLTATAVPESSDPKGRSLDVPGQALAVAALGALSLAVIEGPRWGWESFASVAAFAGSALAAVLFVLRQRGADGALMPLPMFRNRVFSASLGIAAAMTFGMYAMLFLTPLYLQASRGDGALLAGVELLPMSVTFVIVSQLSGKIANSYGPRLPMTLGMAMMGLGLFMLALIRLDNNSLLLIEAALLVIGCGLGLNTAPVNGVAVANAPPARSGTASGLVNTARMVGATLGVAVLGAIFATVAGGSPDAHHVIAGLPPAFIVGGIGEMLGAAAAFAFIRRGSLHPVKR